ncbi:MAG: helix-turn-helix transcriptional regulator [Evtepia sp.]|uniref:helix-turn-helix domain-containing protein n=1 Tax=Evtepia sp. TaxID=2773933 RepID=UPI002A764661|nr:helix-turn-helix transcriptional regulator [Evtepia sp.]MDY3014506.1 helix-turn-helix transcriptional regulator [Evtepia sp.]
MTTGERIKKARKDAGVTQKELGARLGISPQTLAQWENNLRNPKIETLQKISAALKVPVEYLIGTWEYYGGGVYGREASDEVYAKFAENIKRHTTQPSPSEKKLLTPFRKLNPTGQRVAVERVEELTDIPKYQRPAEATTEPPEGGEGQE